MLHKLRSVLGVLLACMVIVAGVNIAVAELRGNNVIDADTDNAQSSDLIDQHDALVAYRNLWDSFSHDANGNPIYFSDYAGEYLDGNCLVILLTNNDAETIHGYMALCKSDSSARCEYAQYSLNELSAYEKTAQEMMNHYNVVGYYIDRKHNDFVIMVGRSDYDRLIANYRDLLQTCPIRIVKEEVGLACTTPLWGGDKVSNEDTQASFSLCIGGTYNGYNSVLTCGHGNEKVGWPFSRFPYIDYFSTRFGQVAFQQANEDISNYTASSYGDFGFVRITNAAFSKTNRVWNSTHTGGYPIVGTYSSVPVGTAIYKQGAGSNYSWGFVQNISVTYVYTDTQLRTYITRGLVQSYMNNYSGTNIIVGGDSGGTVYISIDGDKYLSGIVTASENRTDGTPNHVMYSTPIYFAQYAGFTVQTN